MRVRSATGAGSDGCTALRPRACTASSRRYTFRMPCWSQPQARAAPSSSQPRPALSQPPALPAAAEQELGVDGAPGAKASDAAGSVAAAFVDKVVEHAVSVDEKICQLNAAWPKIVATYQARVREEVNDRALFLRRYEAAARGQTEQTTLAMIDRAETNVASSSKHGRE